ncbi:MAG: YlbF family regulator [Clostridiales bacterium]|jgi:cell fate (sporulation/competence/biofilm development) regulator YlbF (YheA/YmcA/DUF963 family)|nr:YlbF family regulator [Clostridiales bacterium]
MNSVNAKADALVAEIKKSPEYREYVNALVNLDKDEPAMNQLREFKKAEMEYWQNSHNLSFDEERMLSFIYTDLTLNSKINAFLEAEKRLCELLTQIYASLSAVAPITFEK